MAYDPSIFNISPYYDDFDPNNKFLRMLFKPGYAVQARELTQLQTVLQNQISKIGDHLFKDGSRIVAAPISVRNANFLGLNTGTGTPFAAFSSANWSSLVGGTVYWGATASANISHVLPPQTDDKLFVVVDYTSGYSTQIPITGVTVGITAGDGFAYSPFVTAGATYNGLCKLVTIGDGIFYVDGAFVVNDQQTFTPYSVSGGQRNLSGTVGGVTFAAIDKKVGFAITRDTVTSAENDTLLDPSFGSPNYNAPGADRYVINLTLDQADTTDTPDDFIELVRFEDGKITKKVDKVVYGDISKLLSNRTYDESGSYVVNPFEISVRESSTASENLDVVIGPGKAYVYGVEVETKYPTILGISKGRQTYTEGSNFSFNVGNVIGVCLDRSTSGAGGITAYNYLTNMNAGGSVVRFRNASNAVIGEAKVHGFIPVAGFTAWSGFTNTASNVGATAGAQYSLYFYGVCAGSVISGAANAIVYGQVGNTAGITFAVLYPRSGTTFGPIGGSASSDTSLVYEITPSQGISAFTDVVFYGKAVTKSSTLWTGSASAAWAAGNGMTGATFAFSRDELDLPSIPTNNISLIWSDSITTTPTTDNNLLNKYEIVSGSGVTAGLVVSPGDREGVISNATIYKSGEYIKLAVSWFHPGFTAPVKIIAPYKYTISAANLASPTTCIRTKTVTNYSMTGTTVTPTLSLINGRIGFTLPHWDVYSVSGIWREGNSILTDFELDDGQREGFYDYSALVVKKSKEGATIVGSGSFTYAVTQAPTGISFAYKYYQHGGLSFGPFLGKHSYVGVTYSEIPLFSNPRSGRTVSLANCIDFRHSGPTFDAVVAKPYGAFEGFTVYAGATWSNFMPRIDRLSLKINPSDMSTSFAVDTGDVGDLSPASPPETENSMTLATLLVPAYTQSATDVVVNKNDVRRYTMSDIHNVEKRIDDVESFTKLSLSEGEMDMVSIKTDIDSYISVGGTTGTSTNIYSVTTEPVKTSIFTDDFFGHAGGDVSDVNHRCSVDYQYGEMRSLFLHKTLTSPLTTTGVTSSAMVSPDGLITMSYTTTPYITSDGYNKTVKINPTGTVNWLGFIDISKQYEPQFETAVRPVVYSNNLLENDNWIGSNANDTRGFGTQWNDWEYLWTGTQIRDDQKDDVQKRILETPRVNSTSSIPTVNSGNEKTSISRHAYSVEQKVGNLVTASRLIGRSRYKTQDNRVVDRTVVPYIPASSSNIGVTAYGMRPNSTGLNLYVDGVLLKGGLSANANGTVGVTFAFSSGGNLSGEKSIRISDNASTQNATQAADKVFYCKGTVSQRVDGVYSTRNPEYRRQTVTSEGIIKDPFNREVSYDNIQETLQNNSWIDPLCQTFVVDKKAYPEGVFAKSVDLYFSAKDSTLPVTVQLRPTVNGYPSPSVSFPFSTVTVMPSSVNTGTSGTNNDPVATTFNFSSPVYLEPGEYAIAVITNSKNYELYANDSGINLTNTGRSNSPFVGTLYQPQTIGAAVQDLSTDIAFGVNICSFTTATSGTANFTSLSLPITDCQVIKISTPTIVPTGCSYQMKIDPAAGSALNIYNNQNTYLTSVYTVDKGLGFSLTKPSKTYISPAVDAGVFFGIGAKMIATTATNPNTATTTPSSSYVSKAITLPDELASNAIFATAEVCCPYGSEVRAYVRWSDRGESDLFGKQWVQMTAVYGLGSPKFPFTANANLSKNEYDFRPTHWTWFGSNTTPTIRAYQVLLMYTTTLSGSGKVYSKLPATRNFRMSSFRSI